MVRQGTVSDFIVPIRWERFRRPTPRDADWSDAARIANNAARFNLAWITKTFADDAATNTARVPGTGEHDIRPGASAAYGIAVLLKTGAYDEKLCGVSRAEATARMVRLIQGTAYTHKTNTPDKKGWGGVWQSALWCALLGHAGWLVWEDLDSNGRGWLARTVAYEADRFVAPGYRVPYWANTNGKINFPGDTKAEENAWNACVLQVAVAMMPRHTHALAWKRVASELMVSAFAYQTDAQSSEALVDGLPVKKWLNGFNVRDDGAIINHRIVHPDYMATPTLNLRAFLVQPLAGQAIPQSAEWNAARVYDTLAAHVWETPTYKPPGGTIYQKNRAEVYYPMGTDWSPYRFDIFYLFDQFALVRRWDKGKPYRAADWLRLRARRMKEMQARFDDGHSYLAGVEKTSAYPNDPMLGWQIGDALLLRWLDAQNALQTGNWL